MGWAWRYTHSENGANTKGKPRKAERRRENGDRGSVSRLPPGVGRGRRDGYDG